VESRSLCRRHGRIRESSPRERLYLADDGGGVSSSGGEGIQMVGRVLVSLRSCFR
jgi:hypothetical protein